jgi:uncharacterized protein YoxC
MANLNDVLLGLVTTDEKVINKLKSKINALSSDVSTLKSDVSNLKSNVDTLNTKLNKEVTDLQNKINTDISDLSEKVARGSGSYALVDINSPGITSNGTLVTDASASHGKSYQGTGSNNLLVYSCKFSEVNFGHYSICVRAKSSSVGTGNVAQIRILQGSTQIMSQNFTGKAFSSTSKYDYLYSTFTDEGSTKSDLTLQIYLLTSSVTINFDYAYISMTIPSVFV